MSTLVKQHELYPFASFFNDSWTRDLLDGWNHAQQGSTLPQVNMVETNDDFQVEMAVPGMRKENFRAELDNNTLTIWSEGVRHEQNDNRHYTRREFSYQSFKRSFYLPKTVDSENIQAKYQDGILHLVIPKKDEAKKKPVRTIAIV